MPSSKSTASAASQSAERSPSSKPPRSELAKPERAGAFLTLAHRMVELAHADKTKLEAARVELAQLIKTLEPASRSKLIALMSAGKGVTAISDALPDPSAPGASEPFSGASIRDLQRGLGIARATGFDLEQPLESWARARAKSGVEDRVWLSFGKELARSTASEWTCLVAVSQGDALDKAYLRRGDGAWWSFGSQIERPPASEVARLSARQPKGKRRLSVLPLGAVVPARCRADRAALRRAAASLNARFALAWKGNAS